MTKAKQQQSLTTPTISEEELARLRGLIEHEEEQELEKEMKQALRNRRQAVHRQIAAMDGRNKRLLMWVAVILLMLIIISFWLFQFNQIVTRPIIATNYPTVKAIDFEQTKKNLSETLQNVVEGLDKLKQQAAELKTEQTAETGAAQENKTAPIK